MNDLLAKMRCSVVKLQKEMRMLGKTDKFPDEEAMVRQYILAVYSQTRDKMVDFMVVDGTRKEDLTLKETMALMRKAEETVCINGYDFEVNERPSGKGGSNEGGDRSGKGGGSKGQQARNVATAKMDRAKSAYARANSMQLLDVTREMVATLGEDHWEDKFEKRPFAARRPGAHPVGTDNRNRRQKETAMLAGEVPLPKPKPSMHHMQMGAGWKKRPGGGGTGMHFVAVAAVETGGDDRLTDAVGKYSRRYKKLSWFKRWSNTVQVAKAQR